jgi:ATP-binding cassette, subfamily G (WHITE), member 2, SNQ2
MHVQNFGIVVGIAFAFTLILLVFTEINCDISEQRVIMLFKRGRNTLIGTNASDEEKAGRLQSDSATILNQDIYQPTNAGALKPLKMMDTFSWEHLMYTVNVSGNPRRLLNDVSGYVAPGKLTALMGESGAGKVCFVHIS